jgi:hypothetical protein
MNTWNTILRTSVDGLSSAINTLETLSDKHNARILDCLQGYSSCTFLDLLVGTNLDSEVLEGRMNDLCATKVVVLETDIFGSRYRVNMPRLKQILRLAGNLTKGL